MSARNFQSRSQRPSARATGEISSKKTPSLSPTENATEAPRFVRAEDVLALRWETAELIHHPEFPDSIGQRPEIREIPDRGIWFESIEDPTAEPTTELQLSDRGLLVSIGEETTTALTALPIQPRRRTITAADWSALLATLEEAQKGAAS